METTTSAQEITTKISQEIEPGIEELEERIAPAAGFMVEGRGHNHNETLVEDHGDLDLEIEELERVVAPGISVNHNESLVDGK